MNGTRSRTKRRAGESRTSPNASSKARAADRAILKCLEKDKNNRYPDVSALALALQEVLATPHMDDDEPSNPQMPGRGHRPASAASADMLETRRGELPNMAPPPPMPINSAAVSATVPAERMVGLAPSAHAARLSPNPAPHHALQPSHPQAVGPVGSSRVSPRPPTAPPPQSPYAQVPSHSHAAISASTAPAPIRAASRSSNKLIWWVIALLAVGAGVGTVLALLLSK